MEKELRDYFKIDDNHSKIRGFLVLKDENGNILIKKENMIVKSGRELILNAITPANTRNTNSFNMRNLSAMVSEDDNLTTPDSTYANFNPVSGITTTVESVTVENLCVTFTIKAECDSGNYNLSSLGLYHGSTLFSRVVFDKIGLSSNSKLTFTYYIYF